MAVINSVVEKVNQAFDHFSFNLERYEDGVPFVLDFLRTNEIELIINGKSRAHYISENGNAEKIRSEFEHALSEENPKLETAIKRSLHQGGAFFTGVNSLENIIFPRVGLARMYPPEKGSYTHKYIIEVVNNSKVIVKETVIYNKLALAPIESVQDRVYSANEEVGFNEFTDAQKGKLEKQIKNIVKAYGGEEDSESLSFHEPLSLTVQYELNYSEASESYQLKKPTKEDITIDVPVKLAEKLLFYDLNRTFATDVKDFVSRLKEILAKIITVVIGRHTQDSKESSLSDHTEPSNHIDRPRV